MHTFYNILTAIVLTGWIISVVFVVFGWFNNPDQPTEEDKPDASHPT